MTLIDRCRNLWQTPSERYADETFTSSAMCFSMSAQNTISKTRRHGPRGQSARSEPIIASQPPAWQWPASHLASAQLRDCVCCRRSHLYSAHAFPTFAHLHFLDRNLCATVSLTFEYHRRLATARKRDTSPNPRGANQLGFRFWQGNALRLTDGLHLRPTILRLLPRTTETAVQNNTRTLHRSRLVGDSSIRGAESRLAGASPPWPRSRCHRSPICCRALPPSHLVLRNACRNGYRTRCLRYRICLILRDDRMEVRR